MERKLIKISMWQSNFSRNLNQYGGNLLTNISIYKIMGENTNHLNFSIWYTVQKLTKAYANGEVCGPKISDAISHPPKSMVNKFIYVVIAEQGKVFSLLPKKL